MSMSTIKKDFLSEGDYCSEGAEAGILDDTQVTMKAEETDTDEEEEDADGDADDETFVMSSEFEMQLSGEALDALEESLKQQREVILKQEQEFEEMFSRVTTHLETCNAVVVKETETLKAEVEHVNSETKELIEERDSDLMDIRNTEQAFADVHRKYERAIINLENTKASEDVVRQKAEDLEMLVGRMDIGHKKFKQDINGKVHSTFEGYLDKIASLEMENSKLKAVNRRADMRAETLESELAHKQQENEQLSNLADDLIGKSASGSM